VQARWMGNTVNPTIGCELQQRSRRQAGGNRRGGEKPRGRNVTHAGGTAGPKVEPFRRIGWEWTACAENRWRGPRGGDATESPDEACVGRTFMIGRGASSRLQRAGRAGSAEGPGGQHGRLRTGGRDLAGEATRDGGETPREHVSDLRVGERAHGKSSNARSATVKAKGGAREANDSLPCTGRGTCSGVIRAPRHLETTSCIALGLPSSSRVMSRLLPIGLSLCH